MSNTKKIPAPSRLKGLNVPTVWAEFTPLAVEKGAFNLGQGFPDWPCPQFCKEAVKKAVEENYNQYARPAGHVPLVKVLANLYEERLGRSINPLTEVTVSIGATEGLYAIWQSLLEEGDEVIILEPAFDTYAPQVQMAGGVSKFVALHSTENGKWVINMEELEAAFTDRTRAVLLNTPHNPTGKVFNKEELEAICALIKRYDNVILVTDEVYEMIVFDGNKHVYAASLEGMWERTLTVSSSGKTFSTTGWKLGWVVGPAAMIKEVVNVNQWVHYCVPTVLQQAVSTVLVEANQPYEGHANYYAYLVDKYKRKRDILVSALSAGGMKPFVPEGGIFVMADTQGVVGFDEAYMSQSTPACRVMTKDWAFCRWLTIEKGVAAIPPSAFYQEERKHLVADMARFAFCKEDATLLGAADLLAHLKGDKS